MRNNCNKFINKPNYLRDIFSYKNFPKVIFNSKMIKTSIQKELYITDTTFRDGQQAICQLNLQETKELFILLSKLDNNSGIIRMTEMFSYSKLDKEKIYTCKSLGLKFPEISTWIRADEKDLMNLKNLEINETGILMPISDYHIYKKLGLDRVKAVTHYIKIIEKSLNLGIIPRLHFEDITRSDIEGFVIPFIKILNENFSGETYKLRLCDTLGLGTSLINASMPRGIPQLLTYLRNEAGDKNIEWHGHNDFGTAIDSSLSAWLYGANSINCTMMGIGERNGNTPLEIILIWYIQMFYENFTVDLRYIQLIKNFFESNLNIKFFSNQPIVGSNSYITKAGVHINGMLKDKEIYSSYDNEFLLNVKSDYNINRFSGLSALVDLINKNELLPCKVSKNDNEVINLHNKIMFDYENGRKSDYTKQEIFKLINKKKEYYMKHFLVLGGLRHFHRRLYEKGIRLSSIETNKKFTAIKDNIYENIFFVENFNDESIKQIAKFMYDNYKFDKIISFAEEYQLLADEINIMLGLPYNNSKNTMENVINKLLMRQVLCDRGIENISCNLINNNNKLISSLDFSNQKEYILKPINLSGSKSIYKLSSIKDLDLINEDLFNNQEFILEEFINGIEFSVECLTCDGNHQLFGITKKIKDNSFVEIGHIVPADISKSDSEKIKSKVFSVLTALGVKNGPTHTEVILNEQGAFIVETHTRFGGDYIPELYFFSSDIDIMDLYLESIINDTLMNNPPDNLLPKRIAMIKYFTNDINGVLKEIIVPDYIKKDENVKKIFLKYNIGDKVNKYTDSYTRLGFIIMTGDDRKEVTEKLDKYINSVKFVLEERN